MEIENRDRQVEVKKKMKFILDCEENKEREKKDDKIRM